jgi:hypothetical protein
VGALEWSPGGSTYATAGPRSIVCTRDLGFVESMRVYVKVDAVDRSAPNAMDVSDIGTCWYSEEVLANDEGEGLIIAVYDPTVPSQYLYVQRDTTGTYQSFGLPYVDATEPGEPFEGAFAGLSDDDTYFFDVPIADPFPSLNTAIWFGHGNTSVYPRIIVVGIRINGILFGVDENGEGQPDVTAPGTYTGDIWWQDLQNAEQSGIPGTTGVFKLPFANPTGTYEDGYQYGYYEYSQNYNESGQYLNSNMYAQFQRYRDAYRVGMNDGLFDAIDEGGNPHNPTPSLAAQQYALRFAEIDAQRDLVVANVVNDGEYFTVSFTAQSYVAPERYSDGGVFGTEMVDRYNGYYQGYTDGFNDSLVSAGDQMASGQIGNADYNSAYSTGYYSGYEDGPDTIGGGGGGDPDP